MKQWSLAQKLRVLHIIAREILETGVACLWLVSGRKFVVVRCVCLYVESNVEVSVETKRYGGHSAAQQMIRTC